MSIGISMAGVDYCTVLPSWEFDKDPACVVSYLFDSIDGLSEASSSDYVPPNNLMNSCLTLECASNDQLTGDSREPCTLSITSKPQYRVSVLGVDIVSQSRSLEIYDACEGYMMTSRGKRIPCLDAEGGENQSDMYNCRVRLKETLFGFTVKFPSTSNMKKFNIYNIVVILNPETEDEGNVEVTSTFNMDKVRSFVDTDSMSPGAQQLMQSVEQFQQNKKSAVSGLQGMFGHSTSRSAGSGPGMMGLMGLMSMFSNMSSSSQSGSRDTPAGSNITQPSQADHRDIPEANDSFTASQSNARNIPQAINRTETTRLHSSRSSTQVSNKPAINQQTINSTVTSQMREIPPQNDTATNSQASPHEASLPPMNFTELRNTVLRSSNVSSAGVETDGADMYQTLQDICGRVSQLRTVDREESKLVKDTGTERQHQDNPQRFEGDTGEAEGQSSQEETAGGQKLGQNTLKTVVKSCMEEFELRLQTHIDNRLSQIERRLEAKLDSILGVMQSMKGGNSPTPTHIPVYNHTDKLTHVPTEKGTHINTDNASHVHTAGDTMMNTESATHIYTSGDTPRHTESATLIHTAGDMPRHTESATHIHTSGDTPRHTESATLIHTSGDTPRHTESATHIHTAGDTPRHTESATHIHTSGDTPRHTESATHIHTAGDTMMHTQSATHIHTENPTNTLTEGNTHMPTYTQTCTHTPLGCENETHTHLQTETSVEETRNQQPEKVTNHQVMDNESGENS